MRNREFFWPSLLYLTLGGLTSWFIALRWFKGGLLVLGAFLLGFVIFWAFTQWRYREIRMLSAYLARIYALRQPLDVRDNRQGELSILKNDIYKMYNNLNSLFTIFEDDFPQSQVKIMALYDTPKQKTLKYAYIKGSLLA